MSSGLKSPLGGMYNITAKTAFHMVPGNIHRQRLPQAPRLQAGLKSHKPHSEITFPKSDARGGQNSGPELFTITALVKNMVVQPCHSTKHLISNIPVKPVVYLFQPSAAPPAAKQYFLRYSGVSSRMFPKENGFTTMVIGAFLSFCPKRRSAGVNHPAIFNHQPGVFLIHPHSLYPSQARRSHAKPFRLP